MSDAPPEPTTEGAQPEEAEPEAPRRLLPVAIPVLALLFMLVMVFSFSRILLATPVGVAPAIALLVALNILGGAALVAAGRWVRGRPAAYPLLVGAAILIVGGGAVALAFQPKAEVAPPTVNIVARGISFAQRDVTLPAGEGTRIVFANQDAGTQHDIHIFQGDSPTGPSEFTGTLLTGPATVTYDVPALDAGGYFFHCDVHPTQMTGRIRVAEGAEPSARGGPPPGPPPGPSPGGTALPTPSGASPSPHPPLGPGAVALTAQAISFHPDKLTVKPSGGKVTIRFTNQDAGTPHNVAVFQGKDATGKVLFRGEIVTGPAEIDFTFDAPPKGTYFFHCDVHPQMTGSLTVA